MIVDSRRANRLFRRPHRARLGSVECWANIEIDKPDVDLFTAQEDIKDCFHPLGIPKKLGEHFGLPALDLSLLRSAFGPQMGAPSRPTWPTNLEGSTGKG